MNVEDFAEFYGDVGCRSCDASGWIDVYRFVPWGSIFEKLLPQTPFKKLLMLRCCATLLFLLLDFYTEHSPLHGQVQRAVDRDRTAVKRVAQHDLG